MPLNTVSLDFIGESGHAERSRMLGAIRATLACVVTHRRHAFEGRPSSHRNTMMAGITTEEFTLTERKRFPGLD